MSGQDLYIDMLLKMDNKKLWKYVIKNKWIDGERYPVKLIKNRFINNKNEL